MQLWSSQIFLTSTTNVKWLLGSWEFASPYLVLLHPASYRNLFQRSHPTISQVTFLQKSAEKLKTKKTNLATLSVINCIFAKCFPAAQSRLSLLTSAPCALSHSLISVFASVTRWDLIPPDRHTPLSHAEQDVKWRTLHTGDCQTKADGEWNLGFWIPRGTASALRRLLSTQISEGVDKKLSNLMLFAAAAIMLSKSFPCTKSYTVKLLYYFSGPLPLFPGKAFSAVKGCQIAAAFKHNSSKSKVLQLLSWLLNHCLRCSFLEAGSTGKSRNASVSHSFAPLWILSQKTSLSLHSPTEMWSFPREVSPWMCLPSMQNFTSLLLSLSGGFFLPCRRSVLFSFLL